MVIILDFGRILLNAPECYTLDLEVRSKPSAEL